MVVKMKNKMNVGFVGLGKLGLPCALAVESKGHKVYGYDINPNVKTILERPSTAKIGRKKRFEKVFT